MIDLSNTFRRSYILELFDPVQTHALYGIGKNDVERAKEILKDKGATRFRVVSPRNSDIAILCFKLKTK